MNWKCPNCGKRLEFSTEQLVETRGVVVCPQCLSSEQVPGYDAPQAKRNSPSSQPSRPPQQPALAPSSSLQSKVNTPPPHKSRPTPPQHRSRVINFTGDTGSSTREATQPRPKKSGGKKKKAKSSGKGCLAPKSSLGCLWRSVVYTLLLLIVYIIFGLLMQGL